MFSKYNATIRYTNTIQMIYKPTQIYIPPLGEAWPAIEPSTSSSSRATQGYQTPIVGSLHANLHTLSKNPLKEKQCSADLMV